MENHELRKRDVDLILQDLIRLLLHHGGETTDFKSRRQTKRMFFHAAIVRFSGIKVHGIMQLSPFAKRQPTTTNLAIKKTL